MVAMQHTRVTDKTRPKQWDRFIPRDEVILEQSLDGDIVITYNSLGTPGFKKLPCDDGVVTGRASFDHEFFDTTIRPILECAGFEVAVPEYEPEPSKSLLSRIKRLITG